MYRYDELQARACLQPDIRGFGARGAFPRKKCLQPDCGALALGRLPRKGVSATGLRGFGAGGLPRKGVSAIGHTGLWRWGAFPLCRESATGLRGFGAGAPSPCAVSLQPDCGPLAQGRLPRVAKEGYFDRLYILSKYPSGNLSLFYSILS